MIQEAWIVTLMTDPIGRTCWRSWDPSRHNQDDTDRHVRTSGVRAGVATSLGQK
jgi:hypothetical protein